VRWFIKNKIKIQDDEHSIVVSFPPTISFNRPLSPQADLRQAEKQYARV
jgi:hypothetical protein